MDNVFKYTGFLGAKAPLGPLQFVKVKVKPKSFKIEGFARILFLLLETVTSCMPRAKGYSSLFHGCSRVVQGCFMGISWVFYGCFSAFLGVFAYIKWNFLRVCPVSRIFLRIFSGYSRLFMLF